MKIWYLKNHGNASDFHTKNGIPSIQSISRVETEQKFIRIIYGSHFHNFVVYLHVSYMKKILCLYLQFATNQQTACRYLKKCALEGLLNTGRYRVIKRLNVIVLPTWTFQNSSASRERPLTPFRYKLSLLHFKMKEMNFS